VTASVGVRVWRAGIVKFYAVIVHSPSPPPSPHPFYFPFRFFAELVKEVISDLEDSKYQKAEFRGMK
jgi:hypothetical protein